MTAFRAACVQLRSGAETGPNIEAASALIRRAAGEGAVLIATPEVTGFMDMRPGQTRAKAVLERDDAVLAALGALAAELGVWLALGSLAVRLEDEERCANRSFLIGPDGAVRARYDKIHMFDVEVGDGRDYKESRAFKPGAEALLAKTPLAAIGLTICYDLRFPALYRRLAQAGAEILLAPAAFTKVTGQAHWHALLRARAIETGCYVIAAAQGGLHEDGRETFGHSLIVAPWGDVLAEGGTEPGVFAADIDLAQVATARRRIPSLTHDREFSLLISEV